MNNLDIDAEKKKIQQNIKELELAENNKDIEGILKLITEDFVLVSRGAKVVGRDSTQEWLEESVKNFVSSEHVPMRIEVSSSADMAWLLADEINRRKRDESIVETKQSYLLVFKKIDGIWKQVVVCIT